ncbi:MDR family MFS transporter [Actinocorallia sp. B10E7]|uniref:MDR family MFS transporter n=1 Tax=Actinocorallia sp. B10E7 TaxID=3153558 RepID=UPI00325C80C8
MPQTSETAQPPAPSPQPMTHRQILEVLAGLVSMLFVAMISSTIVSTALPTIIGALDGSQRAYTWVFTATLLAMTVSSPLWSKLADLFDKKRLLQLTGVVFLLGSLWAGFARNVPELLAARALQGLGVGGLVALTQAVMGTIIAPRERGRYSGYMASAMAVATVSGPLIGGLLVDTAGWRWCFFATVPFAIAGLLLIQRFLRLEPLRREVRIDWWGALSISVAASLPLVWVSFAGKDFAWVSGASALFLAGTLAALGLAVLVERRHAEPVVPPRIIMERTTLLAVVASVAVGIAQFGGTVFLSQYLQVARGHAPTVAGLLMLPTIVGNMISATVSGKLITKTGAWKRYLLGGAVLLITGMVLLGTIDHRTPIWLLGVFMALMGLGMGALMQNLVLVVQNTVDVRDVGAASGVVGFFRSLGGTVGVAVLGAVLAARVSDEIHTGLAAAGITGPGAWTGSLDLSALPDPVLRVVRDAYADATGMVFLLAATAGAATLLAIWLMPEQELRTTVAKTDKRP